MATLEENPLDKLLEEWIEKKYPLAMKMALTDIVNTHTKFSSISEFVDHAVNQNLVWWSKNPERMLEMMQDTIVTDEQKKFATDFASGEFTKQVQAITGDESDGHTFSLKEAPEIIDKIKPSWAIDSKEGVGYDGYPLLFRFYSRILPAKLSLLVLATLISKEKPYVELEEYQEKSYEIVSDLAEEIRKNELTKRNQKISTGMPLSETKITNAKTKKQKVEAIKKVSSSETKFKNQYVGKLRNDKESGNNFFEGILYALDLIVPKKVKTGKKDKDGNDMYETRIYLSKKGVEYLKIDNPVVSSLIKKQDMPDSSFTQEGARYIVQNLLKIKQLDLEYKFCEAAITEITKNSKKGNNTSAKELDVIFENTCSQWIKNNSDIAKKHAIDSILQEHQNKKKSNTTQTRLQAYRVATMGRLSELGVFSWEIDAHSQSTYKLGQNSDVL
ncbi:MAG: hypothetical protein HOC53_04730 [Candidatus Nitrosopelagicus sp.]|jgi:hypothetical protein|nr:hypothetical protein [Candidatus Nitrosopelagicus sp.]